MFSAMRRLHLCWFVLLVACQTSAAPRGVVSEPPGLPVAPAEGPMLCPGPFLTPEQGQVALDHVLANCPDRAAWEESRKGEQ